MRKRPNTNPVARTYSHHREKLRLCIIISIETSLDGILNKTIQHPLFIQSIFLRDYNITITK